MKRLVLLLALILMIWLNSLAQDSNCNKALRFNHLKAKLDSSICIRNGFYITDIYLEMDLNKDEFNDKVVRSQRINLLEADTIIYSVYFQNEKGQYEFYKDFYNLLPTYFSNYAMTGNKVYDSIKSLYSYPTMAEVEFETNSINLQFYTDAATMKKIFFTYSIKEKTWMLIREIQWFVPPKSYEGDELLDENGRKLEYDRVPDHLLRIEDFDMLKYIGW